MTTPRVTQQRLPLWRILPLLGCCELLPFTRGRFGRGYYRLLVLSLLLRSVLLLPFPTALPYVSFQFWAAVFMVGHLSERSPFQPDRRALYLTRDVYEPGMPCWLLFFMYHRTAFFLFVIEPLVACGVTLFLYAATPQVNLWTEPFFMVFLRTNPAVVTVFDLPPVLQAWLGFGYDILEHANPRMIADALLLSFPVCTVLNSIAEYRAEHAPSPVAAEPKSNAPVLTFPEVRV